ncbi:hypothetical protein GBAR_LOCUS12301, partial [Geodia barretti]
QGNVGPQGAVGPGNVGPQGAVGQGNVGPQGPGGQGNVGPQGPGGQGPPDGYQSCAAKVARRHWKSCCVTSSIVIIVLAALIAGTLALMIYCMVEIIQSNNRPSIILMSTSEVYNLNEYTDSGNTSVYTSKVCINPINEMMSNSVVYLEHGRCEDISTEKKDRTIEHLFSHTVDPSPLNFFWVSNSLFRFNLTLATNSSMSLTIYVFQFDPGEESDECNPQPPETYAEKFVFPNTTESSHKVSCTHDSGKYTCENTHYIKIHRNGRYHVCIFVHQDDTEAYSVKYTLNVREVRYVSLSKFDSKTCHLERDQCCIPYDAITLEELLHPTCTLIKTVPSGNEDLAYSLPHSFSINNEKNWLGPVYLLGIIIILIVILTLVLFLFLLCTL